MPELVVLRRAPVRLALLLLLLPLCPLGRPLVTSVPVPPDYWTANIPVGVLGGPPPPLGRATQQCTPAARALQTTLPGQGLPGLVRPRMVLDRRL